MACPVARSQPLYHQVTGLESNQAYADAVPFEGPVTCFGTCVRDCFFPYVAFCCCPCKFFSEGLSYKLPSPWWRSIKIRLCHRMQSWILRHPCAADYCLCAACCLRPCIALHDVAAYGTTMIKDFRREIGEVWCDNLKVEVAHPETMRLIMTAPQDGGPALGQASLRPHKLPTNSAGQQLYLLDLANGLDGDKAEESKLHTQIRTLMFKYLITAGSVKRQSTTDPVTAKLFSDLRGTVRGRHASLPKDGSRKWTKSKDGVPGFILKYMHYVLFGLDLSAEQFDALWDLYYNPGPGLDESSFILNLQAYAGAMLEYLTCDKNLRQLPSRTEQAIDLYVTAPVMQSYDDLQEPLTKRDFLKAMTTILGLAALQGPLGAASHILANYKRYIPEDYAWEFGDRNQIRLGVLEAMRMQPAVFGSGLVAPKPLRCPFAAASSQGNSNSGDGQKQSAAVIFPANTPVHLNFVAMNWDKAVWGEDADKFDPTAHAANLATKGGCPYPNFNSWGGIDGDGDEDDAIEADRAKSADADHGRECPGKNLSVKMLVDLVELVLNPGPMPPGAAIAAAASMRRD